MSADKPKKRRASNVTRIFGHLTDVGGVEAGTWIVGLVYLKSNPGKEKLREVLTEKLLAMPRFRSRFNVNSKGAHWEEIKLEDMDMDYHVSVALDEKPASVAELHEYCSNLYDRGFDLNLPLWRFTLIPELEDGGACLVTSFSHAIADGVATVGVLLQMLDNPPIDPNLPAREQEGVVPTKRRHKPKISTMKKVGTFMHGVKEGVVAPFAAMDPVNTLKPHRRVKPDSYKKRLAVTEQIPLAKVKEIKNKIDGASVNDVLLTLLTMTVKAYLVENDDPALKKGKNPIRGIFPASYRNPKDPILKDGDPNNRWQSMTFRFPFQYDDGVDALFLVKKQLDMLKHSPLVPVQNANLNVLIKVMPRKALIDAVVRSNARATIMLSNVPGPQTEVNFAGVPITDINFFLFSPLQLYTGLITYNGKVSLGINMGEDLGQDPKELAKHWVTAFNTLYDEVMAYPDKIPAKKALRAEARAVVASV